jgi:hypothetical protein
MSRLTSLFCIPDAVRPFLRYDHRPVLTLACLDVSTWRLPSPETVSIQYYDTISYPEHIAVLDDNIIVAGYEGKAHSHFAIEPSIYGNYHLPVNGYLRDLKTMQNKLLVFPHSRYLHLGDEVINLRHNKGYHICVTPTGFVILIDTNPVRARINSGALQFHNHDGAYTHAVSVYCKWRCITWVGEGDIAFAATSLLQGCAKVYLLSINGSIIKTLSFDIDAFIQMGFSILYDPVWEEYLLSGDSCIMAVTERGIRIVYEYHKTDKSYYFHALTWNTYLEKRSLLFCIRNHSLLGQIEMK